MKKTDQQAASQIDAEDRIRRGLLEAQKGMGRPADDVFDELDREEPRHRYSHEDRHL